MSLYEFESADLPLHAIRTGSAWEFELNFSIQDDDTGEITALDLTLAEARMQFRKKASDPSALISLTQEDGISLSGSTLTARLSSTQTRALEPAPCDAGWDLQLRMPGGDWWTPAQGVVAIIQGRSR